MARPQDDSAPSARKNARDKALIKGRQQTARHLATCDWTVFLTSCSNELLSWKEVVVLYRLRWQIELLFKLWKSHNALADHRSENPVRQLVEFFRPVQTETFLGRILPETRPLVPSGQQRNSKMIAVVIQHWLVITTSWGDTRLSLTKATRLIRDELPQLIPLITRLPELIALLTRWQTQFKGLAKIDQRKRKPSNPQLIAYPELLVGWD